jgi:predicted DsbA family dithiol-disulfide isomerase
MSIEVFAELTCPFTHLSLRRVVARREDLGRVTPTLRVRPWPLEVVNGRPLDPHHVAKEVRALRAQISPDLFGGFDPEVFPVTSMPGLRLAEAAYAVDDATGEAVSLALRTALFEDGEDIADAAVLARVAEANGVEVPSEDLDEQVCAAYEDGERRGVEGSPHFIVAGESVFCPMLDIRTDDEGELHLSLDQAAVEATLDRWFERAESP